MQTFTSLSESDCSQPQLGTDCLDTGWLMTCATGPVVKSGFCLLPIRGSYTSRASGERCPNFVTTSHTFSQFSRKVWTVLLDAKLRSARIVSLPNPKQDSSFFCLPCVSIGAAPSQAAPFEFRSQENSFWQGSSWSQPIWRGLSGLRPCYYTCILYGFGAAWLTYTHMHSHRPTAVNHNNGWKYIQCEDTETYGHKKLQMMRLKAFYSSYSPGAYP